MSFDYEAQLERIIVDEAGRSFIYFLNKDVAYDAGKPRLLLLLLLSHIRTEETPAAIGWPAHGPLRSVARAATRVVGFARSVYASFPAP